MYCYVVGILPLKSVSLSLNVLIELHKNTNSLFHTIFIMFINFIVVKVISQFPILPKFHKCSYLLLQSLGSKKNLYKYCSTNHTKQISSNVIKLKFHFLLNKVRLSLINNSISRNKSWNYTGTI